MSTMAPAITKDRSLETKLTNVLENLDPSNLSVSDLKLDRVDGSSPTLNPTFKLTQPISVGGKSKSVLIQFSLSSANPEIKVFLRNLTDIKGGEPVDIKPTDNLNVLHQKLKDDRTTALEARDDLKNKILQGKGLEGAKRFSDPTTYDKGRTGYHFKKAHELGDKKVKFDLVVITDQDKSDIVRDGSPLNFAIANGKTITINGQELIAVREPIKTYIPFKANSKTSARYKSARIALKGLVQKEFGQKKRR